MKYDKKKEEPLSNGETHRMMVRVNKKVLADYVESSLYELKESTWCSMLRGMKEFDSGKMSEEKCALMKMQGYNLIDMIDEQIQVGKY